MGSFPGIKSGRSVMFTLHSRLVPWPIKSRAKPLIPLLDYEACFRVDFTFTITFTNAFIFTFTLTFTYVFNFFS